jgi:hypothetical protein
MWMLMTFFLGALLLYLVSIASAWGDRREIKKLRKQNLELQQQIITATSPAFVVPDNAQHASMPMPNMTPSQAGVRVGNLMPENAR